MLWILNIDAFYLILDSLNYSVSTQSHILITVIWRKVGNEADFSLFTILFVYIFYELIHCCFNLSMEKFAEIVVH